MRKSCESRIGRESDQGLSKIRAAKHLGEGGGNDLQSLANVFAITDLARSHPGRHFGQKGVVPIRRVVANHQSLHAHSPGLGAAGFLGTGIRPEGVALVRDQPANSHPPAGVEQWQHRLEDGAADVFEIHIDAAGTRSF